MLPRIFEQALPDHYAPMTTTPADGKAQERKDIPAVSSCLAGGTIVDLVYQPEERRTAFAVWRAGAWTIEHTVETSAGERLVPFSPNNNLIKNEVVLLPSEPQEYGSEPALLSEIQSFIHRYVDVRPVYRADREPLRPPHLAL